MISGKLLETYCPDNGQCGDEPGQGSAGRKLLTAMTGGIVGAWNGLHMRALEEEPPVGECNGRMLWLIVGLITLSSPLLILLTQVSRITGLIALPSMPREWVAWTGINGLHYCA